MALLCAAVVAGATLANAQTVQDDRAKKPVSDAARAAAASVSVEKAEVGAGGRQASDPEAPRPRLQLGVAMKSTTGPGAFTGNELGPTFVWRWRGKGSRQDDRLAFAYRWSSFSSRVTSQLGPSTLPVGDLKVHPLMVGLDYKMPRGKWEWSAGMSAGWSMNNVTTPGAYVERATRSVGASDLWVDVHNSFVWGPRLKGWYDRDRRLSYMVEAAYLVTRPELDIRAHGVTTTQRLNADALILKVGIVYGIF